jgi:hypothetical protein
LSAKHEEIFCKKKRLYIKCTVYSQCCAVLGKPCVVP